MFLKRKATTALVAASLAALAISGTFAWVSLNSQKVNEWWGGGAAKTGPGGTLHDDHDNMSGNDQNKQVYIENWGDEPLFVRIRLDEYMEIGTGAGGGPGTVGKSAAPIIAGSKIDDPSTWEPHRPTTSAYSCDIKHGAAGPFDLHNYWHWQFGGQKYYYPAPEGARASKTYVDQGSPVGLAAGSENAEQTLEASVCTMKYWKSVGSPIANIWVMDTDGWAYWAKPLGPGEATGLLLDKVVLRGTMREDYYYGINAVAQMATKDGVDADGGLDNYKSFEANGGWTNNGKALMELIAGDAATSNIVRVEPVTELIDGITHIKTGSLLNGVMYVKQGGSFSISGVFPSDQPGKAIFHPDMGDFENYTIIHNHPIDLRDCWVYVEIKKAAAIGFKGSIDALLVFSMESGDKGGPSITVPFVIIPAECESVVFGVSGRVYIDYGNNTYQELKDDGSLGSIITIDEIV